MSHHVIENFNCYNIVQYIKGAREKEELLFFKEVKEMSVLFTYNGVLLIPY